MKPSTLSRLQPETSSRLLSLPESWTCRGRRFAKTPRWKGAQRTVGVRDMLAKTSQVIRKVCHFLDRFTLTSRYMLSFGKVFPT
jgi:hypothetical protein